MQIEIVTPEVTLFSGEVKLVEVPGSKSPFVMLKNHAPIISLLQKGILRIVEESGRERIFEIDGGVVENNHNKLVALVEITKQNES
jgi:F-type H+-transporting ATPase subunit epsilon